MVATATDTANTVASHRPAVPGTIVAVTSSSKSVWTSPTRTPDARARAGSSRLATSSFHNSTTPSSTAAASMTVLVA